MSLERATDSESFEAYVEHSLAPTLCEGQMEVLDGLEAHRTEKVRDLIEGQDADLVSLPSYSPDTNPPVSQNTRARVPRSANRGRCPTAGARQT
jgi:transposase